MTEIERDALERALTLCLRNDEGSWIEAAPQFEYSAPLWRLVEFYSRLLPLRGHKEWEPLFYNDLLRIFGEKHFASALQMSLSGYRDLASTADFSKLCKDKQPEIRALLARVEGEQPSAPTPPEITAPISVKKRAKAEWLGQALMVLKDNPGWSNARIAREADVHPSTLSKCETFRTAAKTARDQGARIPRGAKDRETGTVEAWGE